VNSIGSMLIFLSGVNEAIDYQDMAGFISPTAFTAPGIYSVNIVYGNEPTLPVGAVPVLSRTLGTRLEDKDTGIYNHMFVHQKTGYVTGTAALGRLEKYLPIHAILSAGHLDNEIAELETTLGKYKAMKELIKPLELTANATTNSDGLVF
jgi:hypothetical protein